MGSSVENVSDVHQIAPKSLPTPHHEEIAALREKLGK